MDARRRKFCLIFHPSDLVVERFPEVSDKFDVEYSEIYV